MKYFIIYILCFEELKLKQRKGIISSETIILCVEDPEKPIGSGGATLNALLIVAEALSARKKFRVVFFSLPFKINHFCQAIGKFNI